LHAFLFTNHLYDQLEKIKTSSVSSHFYETTQYQECQMVNTPSQLLDPMDLLIEHLLIMVVIPLTDPAFIEGLG